MISSTKMSGNKLSKIALTTIRVCKRILCKITKIVASNCRIEIEMMITKGKFQKKLLTSAKY